MIEVNQIYQMDAFDLLAQCDDQSVDAIIADLPYGITALKKRWDNVLPLEPMWTAFKRVIKPHGAIVLTASQPFTSALVMSNLDGFKYSWVWDKVKASGFLDAKRRPLKQHEDICVFGFASIRYHPQMRKGELHHRGPHNFQSEVYNNYQPRDVEQSNDYFPKSIISFSNADTTKQLHPTQKPLALMSYLVRTYTRPGELVLDPTCGSGTTALAARNGGRRYLAGDTDAGYCEIARKRLAAPYTPPLFPDTLPDEPPPAQTSFLD